MSEYHIDLGGTVRVIGDSESTIETWSGAKKKLKCIEKHDYVLGYFVENIKYYNYPIETILEKVQAERDNWKFRFYISILGWFTTILLLLILKG